jgi:quercetin dioxygenase-like cupin family protein
VIEPIADSELALSSLTVPTGTTARLGDERADTLVYVAAGAGSVSRDGTTSAVGTRSAALIVAGERAEVAAAECDLELVCFTVGPDCDLHAPMGPRETVASLDQAGAQQATGARSFQILFDATNGSSRATLFAGYVPPGKAPWHYHLYDEIVWIPDGPGRLHVGESVEELDAGAAFRLQPREVHIVENTGDEALTIIGVFTPAGTPSAAYLTPEVAAAYRFAG